MFAKCLSVANPNATGTPNQEKNAATKAKLQAARARKVGTNGIIPQSPKGLAEWPHGGDVKGAMRELAVDWRLTTQPALRRTGRKQLKSRSRQVLAQQYSDKLLALQRRRILAKRLVTTSPHFMNS